MKLQTIKNYYYKACLIGTSVGMAFGAVAGLAITAASPAIIGYYAAKTIVRRLAT